MAEAARKMSRGTAWEERIPLTSRNEYRGGVARAGGLGAWDSLPSQGAVAAPSTLPGLEPDSERFGRAAKRQAARKTGKHQGPAVRLTLRDKLAMLLLILLAAAIFTGMIFLSAWRATIQQDINQTDAKIAVVQEDIDNLQLAIEKKKNIAVIESKALTMGMIYPAAEAGQLIYLEDIEKGKKAKKQ